MNTTTTTILAAPQDNDPAYHVQRILHLTDMANTINNEITEHKNTLAALLPAGGKVGDVKITVTHPRRLDTTKIAKDYPVTSYPYLYKPQISTSDVRKHLSPADLDTYLKPSDKPVVSLR
ncbi:hypothetical protein [Trueperella sp. LYQ143]|uniref:hypothetical protein n=1 Tax=Trueperella sp. LYQ143 TaxID=3391059 RepID=UPI0039831A3A